MKGKPDNPFAKEISVAETYLGELIKLAEVIRNDIRRAFARYDESGEAIFFVSGKVFALPVFLKVVGQVFGYELPTPCGIRSAFSSPESRLLRAVENIDILRGFLQPILLDNLPKYPDELKKVKVVKTVVVS
jgi:hypothetical protein